MQNDIIRVSINSLLEKSDNPRHITEDAMNKLIISLLSFPEMLEKRPIIVVSKGNKYVSLGGNQRLKALRKINRILDDYKKGLPLPDFIVERGIDLLNASTVTTVPVILADDWTEEQQKEFVVKDNVGFGTWDFDVLAKTYLPEDLETWGVDVPNWENEAEEKEAEEDDYEPQEHVKTDIVLGDLIEIGTHRLVCGDSTDSKLVEKLMAGKLADMVFTDPPYGISWGGARRELQPLKNYGMVANDDLKGEDLSELLSNVFSFNKDDADVYICVSPINQLPFLQYIEQCGKKVDAVIVWDKTAPGLGHMIYRRQCEFILFSKGKPFKIGDPFDIDLWSIGKGNTKENQHGTQKPVGVPYRAIKNSIKKGIVLDLFLGAGSTMLASEQLGVSCYAMELEPQFCQVVINRMLQYDDNLPVKINGKPYTPPEE